MSTRETKSGGRDVSVYIEGRGSDPDLSLLLRVWCPQRGGDAGDSGGGEVDLYSGPRCSLRTKFLGIGSVAILTNGIQTASSIATGSQLGGSKYECGSVGLLVSNLVWL